MAPGLTAEGIQKKSNKTQYLYRQLCHIDKQLSMLGPSGFPTPHSYHQALQQVQRMKGLLEDQLVTSSSVTLDEPSEKKYELHLYIFTYKRQAELRFLKNKLPNIRKVICM